MIDITIKKNAYDAICWASQQFGNSFKVRNEFPGEHWCFSFSSKEQASLFALKWAN